MSDAHHQILLSAARPLVRFALRNSFRLQNVIDLLKQLFVEEADVLLRNRKPGKSPSISQLSLTSGVHRTDVSKFVKQNSSPERRSPTLISRVLSLWESSPKYTTKRGKPRVLPIEGATISFRSLLDEVSPQLAVSGVLLELERTKVVERTARGLVLTDGIHRAGSNQQVRYDLLSSNLETLLNAASDNIFAKVRPFHIHYRTEYDRVETEALSEFRAWLREETRAFHDRVRKQMSKIDLDSVGASERETDVQTSRIALVSVAHHDTD